MTKKNKDNIQRLISTAFPRKGCRYLKFKYLYRALKQNKKVNPHSQIGLCLFTVDGCSSEFNSDALQRGLQLMLMHLTTNVSSCGTEGRSRCGVQQGPVRKPQTAFARRSYAVSCPLKFSWIFLGLLSTRCFWKSRYNPCKVQMLQKLMHSRWVRVALSDYATFDMSGVVNRQNCRMWNSSPPKG